MSSETPMIRQYNKIKGEYPDAILLFRLGDFYEMFYDDAKTASKILGITLTSRNKSEKNAIPLCGVPFHSVEPYIAKLLDHGHKIAICEQIEDPKLARTVVERKVVKVLTPGVILDSEQLSEKTNNYVACISSYDRKYGLSYVDISTGDFKTCIECNIEDLKNELSKIGPREIVLSNESFEDSFVPDFLKNYDNVVVSNLDSYHFDLEISENALKEYLKVNSLHAFNLDKHPQSVIACGALLNYLYKTQMDEMPPLKSPLYYSTTNYLQLDDATKSNLEITKTIFGEVKQGTLLSVLDDTLTAMGGRLLRYWVNYPLIDSEKISGRLNLVEELKVNSIFRKGIRSCLKEISDIERLIGRISTSSCKPRDLGSLRNSTIFIKDIKTVLGEYNSDVFKEFYDQLDTLQDIYSVIRQSIVDNPPNSTRIQPIIRPGYDSELDELRAITTDAKKWIAQLEIDEKNKTGINFLKVGYNRVFGYYLEVTKPNLHLVPESYIRKQTLVNAERFITPELKEFEEKISGAEEKISDLEKKLFEEVRLKVAGQEQRIRKTASIIAELDVFSTFAEIAGRYDYVRPEINSSKSISLIESRHPVIERMDLKERFVPNDIFLDNEENRMLIITGPNMAGKSTLIRQTALCVLLAQIGSFVPARKAAIGVVDRVFTRVGASDNLSRGQSTFMVEMVETAYILRNATSNSLVILDEIGRGTSTFDGMSIAWAVAEYLYDIGCKTMFATHYHELAQLESMNKGIKNFNIYVKEVDDKIIFLRKLVPGATSHSYGIQVAKLAGVPDEVIRQARKVLYNLERSQSEINSSITTDQLELFNEGKDTTGLSTIAERLRDLDISSMTPLEAINKLSYFKDMLDKD